MLAVVTALVGAIFALRVAPRAELGPQRSGDEQLIADVEAFVGDNPRGLQSLSVARVGDGAPVYAGLGDAGNGAPTPETVYELGSITKVFTGMLLADAVDRGEMQLDEPISTYLTELQDTPAGERTPRQLATHTSGMPSMLGGLGNIWGAMLDSDVYGQWDTERLLAAAKDVEPDPVGESSYSNAGVALLGHAVARASGFENFGTLLQERLLDPLSMENTSLVIGDAEPTGFALPHLTTGVPATPWTGAGYAPAGSSTRTTAQDMVKFTQAVLDAQAPGMSALEPALGDNEDRHGLGWANDDIGGMQLTWHNGGTEGSRTMLAIDREAGKAAIVLGNSAQWVDMLGAGLVVTGVEYEPEGWNWWAVSLWIVGIVFLAAAWWETVRRRSGIHLLTACASGIIALIFTWSSAPWHMLPRPLLGILPGLAVGAIVASLASLPHVRWWPGKKRVSAVIELAVCVLLVVVLLVPLVL